MTRQHDLKTRIRDRMTRTGERYVVARSHVLSLQPAATRFTEPAASGYPFRPGVCCDTTAAANALAAVARIAGDDGPAIDEDVLTGLSGGIGFLYIVFEYPKTPPLLSVLTRYDTAADNFVLAGVERLGLGFERMETTSAAKAQKSLDAALESGAPALCVVDAVALARPARGGGLMGMAPTVIAVTGRQTDEYVIDAGRGRAETRSRSELATARAAYKKGRHRLGVFGNPAQRRNLAAAMDDAIAACLHRYEHAPYKGFASNFGFAGMEKWAALLTDDKNAKGWPRVFREGPAACLGLRRAYQGLTCEMTGPGAGRESYSRFLRAAQTACGHAAYGEAADAYSAASDRWQDVARFIAACGVREVQTGCDLLDSYAQLLDEQADQRAQRDLTKELESSANACTLDAAAAKAIYGELAVQVRAAIEAERSAFSALSAARRARG